VKTPLTISLIIVAVVVGSVLPYVFSLRAFRRNLTDVKDETTRRLNLLSDAVKRLEKEIVGLRRSGLGESAAATGLVTSPQSPAIRKMETREQKAEELTSETLVVLAAAVTAFLGKKVRIRSAKMLQSPYEIVNPWAQQGRAIVQASHNLRPRS
jgi:hypothetical protein